MIRLTPMRRAYIYAVALAAGPVLVHYGLLDPKALPVLAPLILALLNIPRGDVPEIHNIED